MNTRFTRLLSAALSSAILTACPVIAFAQGTWSFNLPSQPLADALRTVGGQASTNVFFEPRLVAGRRAPALSGSYTVEDALSKLLEGTGLRFRFVDEKTVAVEPIIDGLRSSLDEQPARGDSVQPTTLSHVSDEGRVLIGGASSAAGTRAEAQADSRTVVVLEEFLVTGSRLKQTVDNEPAPVTIFDSARIEQLGVSNVADILNFLPQQPFAGTEEFSFAGARSARLRGLGPGSTLVLINGRRANISAAQGAFNSFDLNTIPVSAVDRVDVLSGSASAVYGADAVAGVVNIVLKREISEPSVELEYGTADGGAEESRASFAIGHSSSRLRMSAVFDVQHRESLLGSERDLSSNMDFTRFGGTDNRATTTNPANISSVSGNLPGLATGTAVVPQGSSGVGLTPDDFQVTAGLTNRQSLNRYVSLVPEMTRYSAIATAEFDFTDSVAGYAEVFYSNKETDKQRTPNSIANRVVPASNAFNPFGVNVRTSYLFSGLGPRESEFKDESWRATGGVRGTIDGWDWDLSYLKATGKASEQQTNSVDTARVNAALASSDPETALNVFQDGPGGSPDLLESLLAPTVLNEFRIESDQLSLFARRNILSMPAGELQAVIGGEARKESLRFRTDFRGEKKSWAGYTEVRVPLVSSGQQTPGVHSLTATVAGRYDHDEYFGGSFNPQYGLEYRPASAILIRGSYGTSFRAPSLYEGLRPTLETPGTQYPDPLRNNVVTPITVAVGGDRNLEPEDADATSLGFVFTPNTASNLRFEGTYWKINQDIRIVDPGIDAIVLNAALYPDRVFRAPQTPADIAAGIPGELVRVDARRVNAGSLHTSGLDAGISALWPTSSGKYGLMLLGTYVVEYDAALFPQTPILNRAGRASLEGSVPRLKSTATLSWDGSAIGASITGRYTSSYKDATSSDVLTGRDVDALATVDLQCSVNFGKLFEGRVWQGLATRIGVQNAFNEEPNWSAVFASGWDPSQADLRQRFFYLTIKKEF